MTDKTKKIISNTVTGAVGIYGVLGLMTYILPLMVGAAYPSAVALGEHFILIPVAIAVMLVTVLIPFALLILTLILVEMGMYKLLGLKIDW